MSDPLASWVRELAGLTPAAKVEIHEEPHCPDPSCPLRRTVIEWTDSTGMTHQAKVVKPLAYVRRADVERALRLSFLISGSKPLT
ncbi:MAG TPA: hypothetical protein VK737_04995 [Opitutales bacterium]|nr:hypothetical protein [Opitutales bacterium]